MQDSLSSPSPRSHIWPNLPVLSTPPYKHADAYRGANINNGRFYRHSFSYAPKRQRHSSRDDRDRESRLRCHGEDEATLRQLLLEYVGSRTSRLPSGRTTHKTPDPLPSKKKGRPRNGLGGFSGPGAHYGPLICRRDRGIGWPAINIRFQLDK